MASRAFPLEGNRERNKKKEGKGFRQRDGENAAGSNITETLATIRLRVRKGLDTKYSLYNYEEATRAGSSISFLENGDRENSLE